MVEEYCTTPWSFGKCEEFQASATATCDIWKETSHNFNLRIRKSGNTVQVLIPELLYESAGKPNATSETISISFEMRDPEKLKNFFGKQDVFFGVCGMSGFHTDNDLAQVEFDHFSGVINVDESKIVLKRAKGGQVFSCSIDGTPVGTFSTLITFVITDVEEKQDGQSDPKKQEPDQKKNADGTPTSGDPTGYNKDGDQQTTPVQAKSMRSFYRSF